MPGKPSRGGRGGGGARRGGGGRGGGGRGGSSGGRAGGKRKWSDREPPAPVQLHPSLLEDDDNDRKLFDSDEGERFMDEYGEYAAFLQRSKFDEEAKKEKVPGD